MNKDMLTKCVNGISRYKDDLYDLIFIYRGVTIRIIRAVPYDELLKTVIAYIRNTPLYVCGVYQNTLYKSEIPIMLANYKE